MPSFACHLVIVDCAGNLSLSPFSSFRVIRLAPLSLGFRRFPSTADSPTSLLLTPGLPSSALEATAAEYYVLSIPGHDLVRKSSCVLTVIVAISEYKYDPLSRYCCHTNPQTQTPLNAEKNTGFHNGLDLCMLRIYRPRDAWCKALRTARADVLEAIYLSRPAVTLLLSLGRARGHVSNKLSHLAPYPVLGKHRRSSPPTRGSLVPSLEGG